MTRHRDWQHTVLFGDSTCLCDSSGVCRACSGYQIPQIQAGFEITGWDDLIATRDIGDYQPRHATSEYAEGVSMTGCFNDFH